MNLTKPVESMPLNQSCRISMGLALLAALTPLAGCGEMGDSSAPQAVWGRQGVAQGDFQKPRAIAVDADDQLYLVDMLARIQVFNTEGKFLRGWKTPESANGRPCGLTISRDGKLLVADTHYFRVLVYELDGRMIEDRTIGGAMGRGEGEFGFVTDAVDDSAGNIYVAEYGDNDRIQKFSPEGEFLLQWGSHGEEPGQFRRPQNLAVDDEDRVWAVDACNHRVQVFDSHGKLLSIWGEEGSEPGQLYYPYDLVFDDHGNVVICEYGNHRVQKFTPEGQFIASWGDNGRAPGELHNPWAVGRDSQGRLHVVDSNNHRVQRITL